MIYLDNAATTSLSQAALATLMEVSQDIFGNPSSIHHFGRKANQIFRQARQTIAEALHTHPNHIIFTSGGSEADNLAIKGYALANQVKGKHLITTAIEHHAVLHTMEYLEQQFGFEVTYLEPINHVITAQQVQEALRPDTILVSVMYANNETGQILPIKEIGRVLTQHQAVFHVDAVQVVGKLPLHPEDLNIDLLAASAHKFHGPKGVGFLYSRLPNLASLIHGGKQESQHRAGTENVAGIAAMATALEEQLRHAKENWQTVTTLKNAVIEELKGSSIYVNEDFETIPYVLNLGLQDQLNEQILMRLDLAGIAVSSGSACTAGVIQKSHVLSALYGADSPRLTESIRVSFSETNTIEEILTFTSTLKNMITK
ncbi:cysteine desulfurase [Streptococcus sp. X16XC17]|uniref:cysteine desulfurase family protein n=1 Tax=unclassified Streptococcus TaxID=2608887 RepID=UPI00066FDA97|nr:MULTISPECIES: cysteine desulfurase family protein [unclassified Streptococcus]TCD46401.1 cysteine desulfurase [Streptococcus sp. X16XC17]